MIIPGRRIVPAIISNIKHAQYQVQPCGVDLTLNHISKWTSSGALDFDNSSRLKPSSERIPFTSEAKKAKDIQRITRESKPKKTLLGEGKAFAFAFGQETSTPTLDENEDSVNLPPGAYLVGFNETVKVPLELMGQIFLRSSLFRSGATLTAGVVDSGYEGALGAMLQVVNPHGLTLYRNARLAQIVFHQMSEKVDGYRGIYQGSTTI